MSNKLHRQTAVSINDKMMTISNRLKNQKLSSFKGKKKVNILKTTMKTHHYYMYWIVNVIVFINKIFCVET